MTPQERYTQNKGKKLVEKIKWEQEILEENLNFDLLTYLYDESK